jgi:hypothetical protein
MSSTACDKKQDISNDPAKKKDYDEIAELLKAKTCDQSTKQAGFSFLGIFKIGGSGAKAVGCEQLNVMINEVYSMRENIICSASKTVTRIENHSNIIQSAKLFNGSTGLIQCDNIKVGNQLAATSEILNSVSQTQKTEIKSTAKSSILQMLDAVQKSQEEMGNLNTPQQVYQKAKSSVINRFEQTQVDDIITELINNVVVSQDMQIINYGTIKGSLCEFKNEIALIVLSQNVITKVGEYVLNTEDFLDYYAKLEAYQESKSGWAWYVYLIIALIVLAAIAIIGGLVYYGISSSTPPVKASGSQKSKG